MPCHFLIRPAHDTISQDFGLSLSYIVIAKILRYLSYIVSFFLTPCDTICDIYRNKIEAAIRYAIRYWRYCTIKRYRQIVLACWPQSRRLRSHVLNYHHWKAIYDRHNALSRSKTQHKFETASVSQSRTSLNNLYGHVGYGRVGHGRILATVASATLATQPPPLLE
jgi:hypothetical protein